MSQFLIELQSQSLWDWIVLFSGILYVVYAARNNPVCWLWGILSCGILAIMTVVKYKLYADGILNVFYVIMAFIGLYRWRMGDDKGQSHIRRIDSRRASVYFVVGVILSVLSAFLLSNYTQAMSTKLDSITTIFSIIATIWLIQRYIENWLLWIIVDILYIYLYFSRGAMLYGVLFIIYTIIAVRGYLFWKKEMMADQQATESFPKNWTIQN